MAFYPIIWSLTPWAEDDALKALYAQLVADLVGTGGVQITSGNAGDSGFSGLPAMAPTTLLYLVQLELWRRGLIPNKPITRTRAVFRDPVAPL